MLELPVKRLANRGRALSPRFLGNRIRFWRREEVPQQSDARMKEPVGEIVRIVVVRVPPNHEQIHSLSGSQGLQVILRLVRHVLDLHAEVPPPVEQSSQEFGVAIHQSGRNCRGHPDRRRETTAGHLGERLVNVERRPPASRVVPEHSGGNEPRGWHRKPAQ